MASSERLTIPVYMKAALPPESDVALPPPPAARSLPLMDAFGWVLCEDAAQPFHPHDDRIVSLGLHHHITDDSPTT
jgi:hypothetical protein